MIEPSFSEELPHPIRRYPQAAAVVLVNLRVVPFGDELEEAADKLVRALVPHAASAFSLASSTRRTVMGYQRTPRG